MEKKEEEGDTKMMILTFYILKESRATVISSRNLTSTVPAWQDLEVGKVTS